MRTLIITIVLAYLAHGLPQECLGHQSDLSEFGEDEIEACFDKLVEAGDIEHIKEFEEQLNDEQDELLAQILSSEIKKLESIEEEIILEKSTCAPILKWAQNLTHVFMSAKLSHRWDSPPCLKTVSEAYELVNSTLFFVNVCLVSNVEVNFTFSEPLFKPANDDVEVKKDGIGTYSIIFAKQTPEVWTYAFQGLGVVPLWQELMESNSTLTDEFNKKLKEAEAARAFPAPKSDL